MKHIVLGTAGHVDHGKTSLIKAITGIDTDRLKEEKERGITIELGFASLTLPGGQTLGVVDVPGHERFIRNMVSGAAGIDLVVLVIAADEGVMPQTKEHLQICSLLGLKKGLVALTKADLVDEDWQDLVTEDIRTFLKGTFLEASSIIPVSALTGAGLQELLQALHQVASGIEEKGDAGLFRLPIDRVFSMKGFGTVVTGTLVSGNIRTGEDVAVLPHRISSRIRGIQVHNQSVSLAESGQRTAINLQGIEKTTIARGDVLTRPGTLETTRRLDVYFDYLPTNEKKLKHRALVRFHTGACEVMARINFLDRDDIAPGDKAFAQLFLAAPAVIMAGDCFVIRGYSPVTTIGGGVVVDPLSRKHKRYSKQTLHELEHLQHGDDLERIATMIERSSFSGIDLHELVIRTGFPQVQLKKRLEALFSQRQAILLDREETRVIAFKAYQDTQEKLISEISIFHAKFPLQEGMSRQELRTKVGSFVSPRLFHAVMRDLEKNGRLIVDRENLRLPDHSVHLRGEMEDLRQDIADLYRNAGLAPPSVREVTERFAAQKSRVGSVLNVMLKEGSLVKINEDLYFDQAALARLREDYKNLLMKEGKASPVSFKALTGLSRKFIIPLLEYFDMTKLTVRSGEHRVLREKGS
ncbi:MAG: selenocysteine-specific translation elongation factor [Syntrophus sp. (in: bacteria)]|nr:selenocysteine-specific translation elongation factor [Syntrophus sp. (in: bacteria)]